MAKKMRAAAVEAFERQIIKNGAAAIEAWKHYLDAPGAPALEDEYERYAMAQMLATSNAVLPTMEATQTTSVFGTNYQKALLGMTRQVFPRMWGKEIAAIQPLDRPTAMIFHLTLTRDDGSTLGARPQDNVSAQGYNEYIASRTYADHATGEGGAIAKGMALSITSSAVQIDGSKKLKTEATMELVQDLQAYHSLNALELLQGAAVDEIAQEKDALLVKAMRDAAVAHKTVTFGTQAPASWGAAEPWRFRLQRAILLADNAIYRASLRRPNVMVVGTGAFLELTDLSSFKLNPDFEGEGGNYGLQPVGTLSNQYRVLLSRFVPENEILLGRKGQGFLDAGLIYAPYLELFVSERFFDVSVQKTIQSFASRYLIHTVSNTLFARVVIDDGAQGIA